MLLRDDHLQSQPLDVMPFVSITIHFSSKITCPALLIGSAIKFRDPDLNHMSFPFHSAIRDEPSIISYWSLLSSVSSAVIQTKQDDTRINQTRKVDVRRCFCLLLLNCCITSVNLMIRTMREDSSDCRWGWWRRETLMMMRVKKSHCKQENERESWDEMSKGIIQNFPFLKTPFSFVVSSVHSSWNPSSCLSTASFHSL